MKDQYFDDVDVRDIAGNGINEACLVDYQEDRAILLRSNLGVVPSILIQELKSECFELKVKIGPDLYICRKKFETKKSAELFADKITNYYKNGS